MSTILDTPDQIKGHIYLITNDITGKQYVGQAVTHRKNKNKYRPFGYLGRFKDHISEALCNTKKKQCTYLNNAIRLYEKDVFRVELLHICELDELDKYEIEYISKYNSLYPNGYNLTNGGKTFKDVTTESEPIPLNPAGKRGGSTYRSQETRAKMSESLKLICGTPEAKQEQMMRTQKQHREKKLAKFTGVSIDPTNLEQYLRIRSSKDGSKYIKVVVGDKSAIFVGKYETLDVLKERAIQFLQTIHLTATLPNCSGNP